MFVFDSLSKLDIMALVKRVVAITAQLNDEKAKPEPNKITLMKLGKERVELRVKLGGSPATKSADKPTMALYPQEQRRTKGMRQKDNDAALDLLAKIRADGREATDEEKKVLARFSGFGGGLHDKETGLYGSAYEYYTPAPIAAGMWDMLKEMGFSGGKVLDPSAGSGVFAATRPASVAIDQVELSSQSGGVNALVNNSATCTTQISAFEAVAAQTPDETYDAVMTNVPFGKNADRGTNKDLDRKWKGETLEYYFMLRSMDKLKPNGLAAFIVPPRIVSGKSSKDEELRYQLSLRSEFIGAYRLPSKVFQDASDADTIVDVVVFKKYSRDVKEKINELVQQDVESLRTMNVLWDQFINGTYFMGEGHKYQLGEFKAKDPNKFKDVDRVISDQSTVNIAKLMRKFPGSRIDWSAMDATEAAMITYHDGDVIYQDGQTLEYKGGEWVAREATGANKAIMKKAADMGTALRAVNAGITWDQSNDYVTEMRRVDKGLDLMDWLIQAHASVSGVVADGDKPGWWAAVCAGMAAIEVREKHAPDEPFNYSEAYAVLTAAIKANANYASKTITGWRKAVASGVKLLGVIYRRAKGFEARWEGKGAVLADVADLTEDQHFEKIRYENSDDHGFVPVSKLAEVYGEGFDPIAGDDWCISPDGKSAIRALEFFQGNYAEFLAAIDTDIAAVTDDKVRDKLLRMKDAAGSYLVAPDVDRMTFNLNSPYLNINQRLEFLQAQVHPDFFIEVDDDGGQRIVFPEKKSAKALGTLTDRQARALRRFSLSYLQKGNITTATGNLSREEESAVIQEIREIASAANAKINVWTKSNPVVFDSIKSKLLDPKNLEFKRFEDEAPLDIAGMNPELKLHTYQNAEVRRQGKKFGGINGFSVGLGKTFTALASVQYAQAIGVKKKTIFVVPNAVLSNWKKETGRAYATIDDCLFVGLTMNKAGKAVVSDKQRDIDLNRILENKHSKIFMTMEAFVSIPVREKTQNDYQDYISTVDDSFARSQDEKAKKAEAERLNAKKDKLTSAASKSSIVPFFEDMGVDSLVIDEAHQGKNSKMLTDFQSAKFLSTGSVSDRGLELQMKSWFVRRQSSNGDGVLALTATPITNSPLEIYSMLTLAVGEGEMNRRFGIRGADDFMNAFTEVENTEEPDLVGRPKAGRVFLGLQNLQLLRDTLGQIANIKTPDDVGSSISVPEEDASKTSVELDAESNKNLMLMQQVYIAARKVLNKEFLLPGEQELLDKYSELTGEPQDLLAHPFNLIGKMSDLILDKNLEQGITVYVIGVSQKDNADEVIKSFNSKIKAEDRTLPGRWAKPESIKTVVKTNTEDQSKSVIYKVTPRAWVDGDQIKIDSTNFNTIDLFETMAVKAGVDLDAELSPKLAAMLENFRKEQASPKSGSIAKQIIFCDTLAMHHKIRLALIKRCGIPANKIGIINAVAVSDPADMQDLQDGFNGLEEENKYSVIIANKKGEVGVNLQIGTQAIHHLTVGWTPDSLTQRNGRGVRQGNTLGKVSVYYYDANGTFDEYKRMLVGKKSDWIGAVMNKDSATNSVRIGGDLSEKDKHDLIMAMGDNEATAKARLQIEKRERERQTSAARESQIQTLRIIDGQIQWKKRNSSAEKWIEKKQRDHFKLQYQVIPVLKDKLGNDKLSLRTVERLKLQLADAEKQYEELSAQLKDQFGRGIEFGYEVNGRGEFSLPWRVELNPDSPIHQQFKQEVDTAEKILSVARKEYAEQSEKPGAYSADTLQSFESDNGVIVGGILLMSGMIGLHKNQYWLAESPTSLVHPPTLQKMEAVKAVSGFEFVGPADADEDWLPVADKCARIDEETIAANNADGFALGDKRLYSTYSTAIAERLTVEPSGIWGNSIKIKLPYYPAPVNPSLTGGAVATAIQQEQKTLLEWRDGVPRLIRVADQLASGRYPDMNAEVCRFARLHGLKISASDLTALRLDASALAIQINRQNDSKWLGFAEKIASVSVKTTPELADWFNRFVRDVVTDVDLDSGFNQSLFVPVSAQTLYKKAVDKIDAGGVTVIWLDELLTGYATKYGVTSALGSEMERQIEEAPGNFVIEGKSAIEDREGIDKTALGLTLDFEAISPMPNSIVIKEAISKVILTKYGDGTPGSIVLWRKDSDQSLIGNALYSVRYAPQRDVSDYIKAQAVSKVTGGIDVSEIIKALRDLPSVTKVEVLDSPVYRAAKYGNGSYTYEPGTTIAVTSASKTGKWSEFSDRETGCEGRHWDKNRWIIEVRDGQKTSNGSKVASANDMLEFFGVKVRSEETEAA